MDKQQTYAFDWIGGPVYRASGVSSTDADALRADATRAQIISLLTGFRETRHTRPSA